MNKLNFKTLSSEEAINLDKDLIEKCNFSIDQLIEFAGISTAQAIQSVHQEILKKKKTLFLIGPGNNGADGMVVARNLINWGALEILFYYPKKSNKLPIYSNLYNQMISSGAKEIELLSDIKNLIINNFNSENEVGLIVDAFFGFSSRLPLSNPFKEIIKFIHENRSKILNIVSIDIPSGWDVENGPRDYDIDPSILISLSAPKTCAKFFTTSTDKKKIHFLAGRFINKELSKKYQLTDLIKLYNNESLFVQLS